mmetsp:Transcript_1657/g.4830  ORF Transcript_1657/g.4830 Transcript_1657/m.4830 type:complete len:317 (-) Transcript_1657:14-964(-)
MDGFRKTTSRLQSATKFVCHYNPFGPALPPRMVLPTSFATDRLTPYRASPALPRAFFTDCSWMYPSRPPISSPGFILQRLATVGSGSIIMLDRNSIAPAYRCDGYDSKIGFCSRADGAMPIDSIASWADAIASSVGNRASCGHSDRNALPFSSSSVSTDNPTRAVLVSIQTAPSFQLSRSSSKFSDSASEPSLIVLLSSSIPADTASDRLRSASPILPPDKSSTGLLCLSAAISHDNLCSAARIISSLKTTSLLWSFPEVICSSLTQCLCGRSHMRCRGIPLLASKLLLPLPASRGERRRAIGARNDGCTRPPCAG